LLEVSLTGHGKSGAELFKAFGLGTLALKAKKGGRK
jgi:hypothetical protein